MRRPVIGIATAALVLTASAAWADPAENYAHLHRRGLMFGAEIGGGDIRCSREPCEDFLGAGSFDLHIGGMAGPGLAFLFDAWWMVHDAGDFSATQGIMTASGRYWPVRHLWLSGGIGVARTSHEYRGVFGDFQDKSEWVPAFQLSLGVEPVATAHFGLSIALRYGTGFYSDEDTRIHNVALALGVDFY